MCLCPLLSNLKASELTHNVVGWKLGLHKYTHVYS